VAQEVVRARFEPVMERYFHRDLYGFRPGKSALEAVRTCREWFWKYDWVRDVDIQKFFDTIDHELMMKAVEVHSPEDWMVWYTQRWLKAPVQDKDGKREERQRGTPQGGVISPLLANLYLHYEFDKWMERTFPEVKFERFADDIVIHCESQDQAEQIERALAARLQECKLTLHPEKTKVVYCKYGTRKGRYPTKRLTFLGYTFNHAVCRTEETNSSWLDSCRRSAPRQERNSVTPSRRVVSC
jgi:group II intron reverse transcriptase/maturase